MSSSSSTSLCNILTSPSSRRTAQAEHSPSRQEYGAFTPLDSRCSSSVLPGCQSSKACVSPSSSTSRRTGACGPSGTSMGASVSDSASATSWAAAATSATSPKGLPPSETNFSWWRRSRGNSSSRNAVTTIFMKGAGPQTKASQVVYADANAFSCSPVGRPCTDSSQCTTCSRSGCSAASRLSSSAKITERSSRLA